MMRNLLALCVTSATFVFAVAHADDRPNIVWITAEDMSPTLGCYGDQFATTPNIDHLAAESVRYTNAFATAPVCSPSRSCLITGCYAPSLGTHQMRSAFPIPNSMRGFPALLRAESYFTTNNVKTDYNTGSFQEMIAASWDECSDTAHWRNRADNSKPFFSIFNLMTSHQSRSMVWTQERFRHEVQSQLSPEDIHDPELVPLPPYYPDTMVVRRTMARFYDCVTAMDAQVGSILAQLKEDGLDDETIVFCYSDHGSGLPRHKRLLHDSGMHVPLLIKFPAKYAHLAPVDAGQTLDRLVSFVDFAPTVLQLANIDVPADMQGVPFLGSKSTAERQYVFGHRDRVDEAIDMARSVRDQRFLYIRNYMPHLGYNERTWWPDMGEIRHEFYRVVNQGIALNDSQRHFTGPHRAVEELYDCETDPQNVKNLAQSEQHQEVLVRLRAAHREHVLQTRDLGFIPEAHLWSLTGNSTPWEMARSLDLNLGQLVDAAGHVGVAAENDFAAMLANDSASVRYWGTIGLCAAASSASRDVLLRVLHDPVPAVRISAADALCRHGYQQEALPTLIDALADSDMTVVLQATRIIELLGEAARVAVPAMRAVAERAEKLQPATTQATFVLTKEQDLAMFCSFSANGFLAKLGEGDWINLFGGKSLAGWKPLADGQVDVNDGEIQMLAKGKNLWLIHEHQFTDFELMVEALMPSGSYNSGIAFRSVEQSNGRPAGYQCEIADAKSGMLYGIGKGWIWPKDETENKKFTDMAGNAFEIGKWNHFRISCEGDRTQIWVNGIQTVDVKDASFQKGSIAIQHHGKGGLHRFRNITIRTLNNEVEER